MTHHSTVSLTPRAVAALLRASLATIRTELEAVPPEVHVWHPEPGEWCAKEIVGHLIEAEGRGFAGRVRAILAATGVPPQFATWDQDAVARARGDCERPAATLLEELARIREASVALVAGLHGADYARGGEHPTVGFLRIGDLLHEWIHHDRNHLKQILANVQSFVWPHMGNAQRFSRPGS
jgi:DinB family protein